MSWRPALSVGVLDWYSAQVVLASIGTLADGVELVVKPNLGYMGGIVTQRTWSFADSSRQSPSRRLSGTERTGPS